MGSPTFSCLAQKTKEKHFLTPWIIVTVQVFSLNHFPPSFFRVPSPSPFDGVAVWVLNAKLRDATGLPLGIYGYGVEAWSYSDFWVCEDTQLFEVNAS